MTTFIQIAHRLRFHRADGSEVCSERPREKGPKGYGRYLDTDAPTLVEIGAGDVVDVPFLLKTGAIARYTPPVEEVTDDGEDE